MSAFFVTVLINAEKVIWLSTKIILKIKTRSPERDLLEKLMTYRAAGFNTTKKVHLDFQKIKNIIYFLVYIIK